MRAPSGRPPAWEEGKAIPWPTPGEQMAEQMQPHAGPEDDDGEDGPTT